MKFTYFKKPINNIYPYKDISLYKLYSVIVGNYYRNMTYSAREIKARDNAEYRRFKAANFDYVTIAGTFTKRVQNGLKQRSGLMCLDLDHEPALNRIKRYIIKDKYLNEVRGRYPRPSVKVSIDI